MTDTDMLGPGSGDEAHEEACGTPHPYAGRPCTRPAGHSGGHGNDDQAWLRDTPEPDDHKALADAIDVGLRALPPVIDGDVDIPAGEAARLAVSAVVAAGFRRHPEPVKPRREDVARALYAHRQSVGDFPDGFTAWEDLPELWRDEWLDAADAVLALWPGRSEADVLGDAADWIEGVDLDGQEHVAARLLRERGES